MKKVLIYVRVSNAEQVKGYSLEEQVAQCKRFFDYKEFSKSHELLEPFVEAGVSTKYDFRQRPQGGKLFLTANAGDVVLFAKLDRAFRNTVDCLTVVGELKKRGVTVIFLDLQIDTSTPVGEFALTILAAGARMERLRIGERSKEGLRAAMAKGKLPGPPPFGARRSGSPGHTYYALYGPEFREAVKLYRLMMQGHSAYDLYWWLRREGIQRPRTEKELKKKMSKEWPLSTIEKIPKRLERLIELVNSGRVRVTDKTRVPKTIQELMEDSYEDASDESDGSGTDDAGSDSVARGSEADRVGD